MDLAHFRLYVGYTWLTSGWGKLSNPAWVQSGEALKGFWERAVAIPEAPARPLIAFGWYRTFLETLLESGSYTWFAKLVVAGELLIGLALILGMFTGIAALFGGFMNWNFMMAGSASINPMLFFLAVLLVSPGRPPAGGAWTAGYCRSSAPPGSQAGSLHLQNRSSENRKPVFPAAFHRVRLEGRLFFTI